LPFHHPRITGTVKLAFNEQERTMNKRIIGREAKNASPLENEWLALEDLAQVEVTSEDPTHPIELGLLQNRESGWRAAGPGPQIVRLVFDQPQRIKHVHLEFREHELARTQQFLLRWSSDGGRSYREIVRQQYNFSPPRTTEEREDYSLVIDRVTNFELSIVPDISGGPARASLQQLRIA
jgi:hypothetical protein